MIPFMAFLNVQIYNREQISGDETALHLDCINIHILVVISYSIYARCNHLEKVYYEYKATLCCHSLLLCAHYVTQLELSQNEKFNENAVTSCLVIQSCPTLKSHGL